CFIQDTIHNCSWSVSVAIGISEPGAPQIFLSGDSLVSSPSNSYQWFLNGNEIPGATSQSFHPDTTGNYSVEITNLYGCTAMSDLYFFAVIPTSIEESITGLQNEKWLGGTLKVFNIFGEEIFSGTIETIPFKLELEKFSSGIYYVAVRKENLFTVFKLVNAK
ncbi:MAG: hypothetical protein ACHQD9_07600, partial [Chitinophagales bacterium]